MAYPSQSGNLGLLGRCVPGHILLSGSLSQISLEQKIQEAWPTNYSRNACQPHLNKTPNRQGIAGSMLGLLLALLDCLSSRSGPVPQEECLWRSLSIVLFPVWAKVGPVTWKACDHTAKIQKQFNAVEDIEFGKKVPVTR